MKKIASKLIEDYAESYQLDRDELWFVYTIGLHEDVRSAAEHTARKLGFREIHWLQAQGVITTHGGPAAFGIAGFAEDSR